MLSQSDSVASTSLHRSKSNPSVKERRKNPLPPEPVNPEQARVHALIAAHRAMDRSQSRSSGDLGRSDSSTSRRAAPIIARDSHIHFSPHTQLRRQRSALQSETTHLSAALRAPHVHIDTHSAEAGLAEFGRASENYAAEPSSYRKIRRTKSVLTPRRRLFSNTSSPQHTPFSQAPTLRNAASNTALADSTLKLRLKRSLNALRPASRLSITRRPQTQIGHHDEAVQMAREQFLADLQDDNLPYRPTAIFNPKTKRQQKSFRKSVRTRNNEDAQSLITSDQPASESNKSDCNKRSFSATLRDRFKRAFGISVKRNSSMPPQQLEASQQHFSDDFDEDTTNNGFDNYIVDDNEGRRQSFYVPSKTEVEVQENTDRLSPTFHDFTSQASLHPNARSRCTSWTNSTVTATTASIRGTALERNRLSIIKEDGGPHQPSSSAGRHIGGVNIFQDPREAEDEHGRKFPEIDSKRVYSALLKRIGEEEAEMEQTKTALENIQNHRGRAVHGPYSTQHSTIRAISSTTVGTLISEEGDPHMHQENVSPDEYASSMTPQMHKHNVERRRAKLLLQEEQASFFPFSSEEQSKTPSPFRRLLQERRSQAKSDHTLTGLDLVDSTRRDNNQQISGVEKLGMSSESIYSRTTDGGVNGSYQKPVGSSEDMTYYEQQAVNQNGMATIIPVADYVSNEVRPKLPSSAGSNERREWSGWMKDQMATLSRTDARQGHHRREHAQIDPGDVEVGTANISRPPSRKSAVSRFPLLDLQEVPRNNTPVPKRSSSLTRSQSGLLKRVNSVEGSFTPVDNEENGKFGVGFRKVNPGNIAKILKERKSQMLGSRTNDKDKENSPTGNGESPPVSTPGRLHLQMRSGNGRLRKKVSDTAMVKIESTSKVLRTPLQSKPSDYDESPTDRIKQSLSARLSRPFNMDVPAENRPFDSMYLGKREAGLAGARLSVAPRGPHGYGGLGPPPFQVDTALPQGPPSSNNSEKMKGLWSSKRLVSDFLRKRRESRSASDETPNEDELARSGKEVTPAFL